MHYHDTIKIIAKAYLSNPECFVQEAVYHIFPKLKLRRMFPGMYYVNTNLLEQTVQMLLSEKELSRLRETKYQPLHGKNKCNFLQ